MSKRLFQRLGAVCTGAVLTLGSLCVSGGSAPINVSAAEADNYAKLLQYSLYLYDANMCGNVSGKSQIEWRGNCHMDDAVPGGYHDAGDHAMFGLPQGWAASMLGWAYYEYPKSFDSLGLTDHFKTVFHYFTDFFKASTQMNGDSVSRILYQKGDGHADHMYWGAPENQSGGREMMWSSDGSSDIAAHYAAALAQDYMFFGDSESLKYAEALYQFSTRYNKVTSGGHEGFYSSEYNPSCQDEQAWAAGWLYLATKKESYKNDSSSKVSKVEWTHSWGSSNLGAAFINAEITGNWSNVESYVGSKCTGSNYLCMDGWGSARYNCGMQFFGLTLEKRGHGNYKNWAKGQMDIILGANGGQNYVVGWNDKSPTHCHHRAASGMTDAKSDSPNKYSLVGALVGGPNSSGVYVDQRYDEIGYQVNEVALDYQANLVCAAAALYDAYHSGSTVTSIPGVKNVVVGPIVTGDTGEHPTTTTTTTTATTGGHSDESGSLTFSKASDIDNNPKWVVNPSGASKLTFNFKTNSNDTQANGCFEINGKMTEWKASPSGGTMTVECEVPAGASEVYVTVWWPTSSTLESVIGTGISNVTTTTTTMTTTTTTTTNTTTTTTATTTTTTTTSSEDINKYEYRRGDVDCNKEVNIMDAVLLARLVGDNAGNDVTEEGKANANTNNDGVVDSNDLNKLMRYLGKYYTWAQFNA